MKLNYRKKNINFISNYNYKIYKLHLFSKLMLMKKNVTSKLLKNYINFDKTIKTQIKWIFYKRDLMVPLRILRYSLYFDSLNLRFLNLKKIISNKILVYNGKKLKPINIYKVV